MFTPWNYTKYFISRNRSSKYNIMKWKLSTDKVWRLIGKTKITRFYFLRSVYSRHATLKQRPSHLPTDSFAAKVSNVSHKILDGNM